MKHFPLLVILCFSTSATFSQVAKDTPTIQVIGKSKVSVKPDIGVLIIAIREINMNFSQSIGKLNEKTKDISKQIVSLGFKEEEIKTTDFEIEVNRKYRRDETIDSGYVAHQNVKVEFKNQKETLTKILTAFSKSGTDFTLSFDFKLSEDVRTKVQDELLKLAVADAKERSKLIAESAGVKVKRIKDISYGNTYFGGMQEVEQRGKYAEMAGVGYADPPLIGFTPNDLLYEDTVMVTWEIE